MVSPDDLTGFFSTSYFDSFGTVAVWIGYVLASLLILGAFAVFGVMLQHRTKVTYFPLIGDTRDNTVTLGRPKKDYGRRTKEKGIQVFKLLLARKTIRDIPYQYEYPDGVFLLRKSKDEFTPIPRPVLGNPSVAINVVDQGLELWDQIRAQQVRRRFADEDLQRKQMMVFAGVIIGCLIFAGIVIWMSYATSAATRADTGQIINALDGLASRIGIGGPG